MKVLAIGAHPDDIEIFMLGLLMSFKERKDDIFMAVATDGSAGSVLSSSNLVAIRKQETKAALNFIGTPHFFGLQDDNFLPSETIVDKIKKYIYSISPDIIVTHSPEDYHPDHRKLSVLIKDIVGFACPILYSDTLMGVNFMPDYYVDITPFFKRKTKAILEHKSQDPQKFLEATKILNRFRSAQCNAPEGNYAEAYRQDKTFPFSDIRSLLPPGPKINPFYKSLPDSMI